MTDHRVHYIVVFVVLAIALVGFYGNSYTGEAGRNFKTLTERLVAGGRSIPSSGGNQQSQPQIPTIVEYWDWDSGECKSDADCTKTYRCNGYSNCPISNGKCKRPGVGSSKICVYTTSLLDCRCVKGQCQASCDSNDDCDYNIPNYVGLIWCNLESCQCNGISKLPSYK